MSTTTPRQVACPQCGKLSPWSPENPYRPFCSERCKLIDLGVWANNGYAIPGESIDEKNQLDDSSD